LWALSNSITAPYTPVLVNAGRVIVRCRWTPARWPDGDPPRSADVTNGDLVRLVVGGLHRDQPDHQPVEQAQHDRAPIRTVSENVSRGLCPRPSRCRR
jgi:hypothetical protein